MRSLFTFLFLAVATACFAQKQETYFLKNDGSVVSSIDNADYIRTVTLPDKNRNTYLVADFYKAASANQRA